MTVVVRRVSSRGAESIVRARALRRRRSRCTSNDSERSCVLPRFAREQSLETCAGAALEAFGPSLVAGTDESRRQHAWKPASRVEAWRHTANSDTRRTSRWPFQLLRVGTIPLTPPTFVSCSCGATRKVFLAVVTKCCSVATIGSSRLAFVVGTAR
jgi:hypothetical protein